MCIMGWDERSVKHTRTQFTTVCLLLRLVDNFKKYTHNESKNKKDFTLERINLQKQKTTSLFL